MNKIRESANFVIANCYFENGTKEFVEVLQASESYIDLGKDFEPVPVSINSNIPLPPGFLIPMVAYRKDSAQIVYTEMDRRIEVSTKKYDMDSDLLKQLFKLLSQLKLQDVTAIGINYSTDCCTGDKRLSIFNEKIDDTSVSDWTKNKGFTVTIPLDLVFDKIDCCATFNILKVDGGIQDDKSFKDYIYRISVNYNFTISEDRANLIKRLHIIDNIIDKIDELYKYFDNKCLEITSL